MNTHEDNLDYDLYIYDLFYNNLQNYYEKFYILESKKNLNVLYEERINLIDYYLYFLNDTKSIIYKSNISNEFELTKIYLDVPPRDWFIFNREITFFKTFQSCYNKIQNEIDDNIKNINLQKKKKIYSKFGYKKTFFEIKSNIYNLLKILYDFINYLKDYQDKFILYKYDRFKTNYY
jgi:hypothetical protein